MGGLLSDFEYSKKLSENPSYSNELYGFNDKLKSVYSSLTTLNGVQTNAISRQTDIKDIIDKEADRLKSKQDQIDQAAKNQKRLIYFKDNSRKVYAAYLKIMITAVFTLAIVWIIRLINFHVGEFIPQFITNISMIATVSIGAIIMYNYYIEILSRDRYNFDELKLNPPGPLATPSPMTSTSSSNTSGSGICIGQNCCHDDTVWISTSNKCVAPTPTATGTSSPTQGFTLMYEPVESYEILK